MHIDFLIDTFLANKEKEAIIWHDEAFSYGWLLSKYKYWLDRLKAEKITNGSVVMVQADFSPNSVALMLALFESNCIFVPLTKTVIQKKEEFIQISEVEYFLSFDEEDNAKFSKLLNRPSHTFYKKLKKMSHPGLVVFSSGSTGNSKAAVHDVTSLLKKFQVGRNYHRAITFLLYDHLGGINTLLYLLSNGGLIVTISERSPDNVLRYIEKYKVDLLPTSPTFINLILISEAFKRHDLSSLKIVSYGTEPMPESTLKRFHSLFPDIRLLQTYGLSELGVMRSKSKSSDSLWIKIGGEDFKTRIKNGQLEIKSKSAMLGYLNAPSPFTDDGWFITGDVVEEEGEYLKILGRKSEIINVGGEKVFPQEVESIIQDMENISEVTVYGEKNPITGQIVCAKVSQVFDEDPKQFVKNLKIHCLKHIERYKVPVKVKIISKKQHSDRFKKKRL